MTADAVSELALDPTDPVIRPISPKERATFFLALVAIAGLVCLRYHSYLYRGWVGHDDHRWLDGCAPPFNWSLFRRLCIVDPSPCYRPAFAVYFALMESAYGRNSVPFHVWGLIWHALDIFLYGLLVYRLWRRPLVALLSAAAFFVYPHYDAAVWWIGAHCALLMAFFYFAALHAWLSFRISGKRRFYILAALCFFLAIESKEDAYSLVLVLPAFEWLICRPRAVKLNPLTALPFLIAVAIAFAPNQIAHRFFHGLKHASHAHGLVSLVEVVTHVKRFYTLLICGFVPASVPSIDWWVCVASIIVMVWPYLRHDPRLLWAIIFTAIASLPVPIANPLLLTGSWYYYLPAAALCTIVVPLTISLLGDLKSFRADFAVSIFAVLSTASIIPMGVLAGQYPLYLEVVALLILFGAAYCLWRAGLMPGQVALVGSLSVAWGVCISYQAAAYTPADQAAAIAIAAVSTARIGWWAGVIITLLIVSPAMCLCLFVALALCKLWVSFDERRTRTAAKHSETSTASLSTG